MKFVVTKGNRRWAKWKFKIEEEDPRRTRPPID